MASVAESSLSMSVANYGEDASGLIDPTDWRSETISFEPTTARISENEANGDTPTQRSVRSDIEGGTPIRNTKTEATTKSKGSLPMPHDEGRMRIRCGMIFWIFMVALAIPLILTNSYTSSSASFSDDSPLINGTSMIGSTATVSQESNDAPVSNQSEPSDAMTVSQPVDTPEPPEATSAPESNDFISADALPASPVATEALPSPPLVVDFAVSVTDSFDGPEGSSFGGVVSMDSTILASGAPLFVDGRGAVYTGVYSGDGWELIFPALVGDSAGDGYGTSIDTLATPTIDLLAVGAPSGKGGGATYVYALRPARDAWFQLGSHIQSPLGDASFGTSVAIGMAQLPRLVSGAPKTYTDVGVAEAGSVHVYEWSGINWDTMTKTTLYGRSPFDWFGGAVDMTSDGSRFIVGAPGNSFGFGSYFHIYEWEENAWILAHEQSGSGEEAFGSSVVALSGCNNTFVVGGPKFENNAGRVAVFKRSEDIVEGNKYEIVGSDIVGEVGDALGGFGAVSGSKEGGTITLFLGTAAGKIKMLQYNDSSNQWETRHIENLSVSDSGIALSYTGTNGLLTGSGEMDKVVLYDV